MSLTITTRNTNNVTVLNLSGKLTLGEGCSNLRNKVRQILEQSGAILIDLSGLSYIDSAGLGELVSSYASAKSRGLHVKLLRPGKRVDSMLQITKLYTTFEVFEDEAAALATY